MIRFRKLYQQPFEGQNPHALIAHKKIDWHQEMCDHGAEGHAVITQYRHKLMIDLWIAVLMFEWVKSKPNNCKFKQIKEALKKGE